MCSRATPTRPPRPAPPRFDWGASGSLAASPAAQLGRLLLSRSLLFSFHEPAGTGSEPAYGESPLSNGTLKGSRSENQGYSRGQGATKIQGVPRARLRFRVGALLLLLPPDSVVN